MAEIERPKGDVIDVSGGLSPPAAPTFPPVNLPTLYVDGFASVAPQGGVMKMYLLRNDPELNSRPETKPQIFAQMVMPVQAFIHLALFLPKSLEIMVTQGVIDRATVDQIRQAVDETVKSNWPAQGGAPSAT